MKIERVDPREYVAEAADVLPAAWKPPRLRYAVEDLEWQFSRPDWIEPRGWLAWDDRGMAVGFVALMARTIRVGRSTRAAWLSSYFSARPGAAAGAALALIRAESRALHEDRRPLLVFAQSGSPGEAMLGAFDASGLHRRALGLCRIHLGMPAATPDDLPPCREVNESDWSAVLALLERRNSELTIRDAVTEMTLAHDCGDPRGRCWAIVEGTGGESRATACTYVTTSITREGTLRTATLSCVNLSSPGDALALKSLVRFASSKWAEITGTSVVTFPNPSGVEPATLRSAALRATPAAWAAFAFTADADDPIQQCTSTDIEII